MCRTTSLDWIYFKGWRNEARDSCGEPCRQMSVDFKRREARTVVVAARKVRHQRLPQCLKGGPSTARHKEEWLTLWSKRARVLQNRGFSSIKAFSMCIISSYSHDYDYYQYYCFYYYDCYDHYLNTTGRFGSHRHPIARKSLRRNRTWTRKKP